MCLSCYSLLDDHKMRVLKAVRITFTVLGSLFAAVVAAICLVLLVCCCVHKWDKVLLLVHSKPGGERACNYTACTEGGLLRIDHARWPLPIMGTRGAIFSNRQEFALWLYGSCMLSLPVCIAS